MSRNEIKLINSPSALGKIEPNPEQNTNKLIIVPLHRISK